MEGDDCNVEKQQETKTHFISMLGTWMMTVMECTGTDENRGGVR